MKNPRIWIISSERVTLDTMQGFCEIIVDGVGGSFKAFESVPRATESASVPDAVIINLDFRDDILRFRDRVSRIKKGWPNVLIIAWDGDFEHERELMDDTNLFIAPASFRQTLQEAREEVTDLVKNTTRV